VVAALGTIFTQPDPPRPPYAHGYPAGDAREAERAGLAQIEVYERLEKAGGIAIVRTRDDLLAPTDALKVVILMEGADPIRSPEEARRWFDRGVRIVGMAWAMGTRYAGGNHVTGPLTAAGRELAAALDEAGAVHDLSHLSDEAAASLLDLAQGPVVATHSNCRALVEPIERHLRDDQIAAIAARGGIIGLNLYSKFLRVGARATIADAVRHLQHAAAVIGRRDALALGSDMDGGFPPADLPEDLDHPSKLPRLAAALRDAGWTAEAVDGFAAGNWRRFLFEHLPR
jgi:membrane dipeptidase